MDYETALKMAEPEKTTKRCSHCHQEFPLEAFNKMASSPDGYQYSCKGCQSQMQKDLLLKRKREEGKGDFHPSSLSDYSTKVLQEELAKRRDCDLSQNFTPRILINALFDLGYRGELTYIQKIKLSHD